MLYFVNHLSGESLQLLSPQFLLVWNHSSDFSVLWELLGGVLIPKAQKSQFEKSPIAVAGGDLNWSAKKRAKLQKAAASEWVQRKCQGPGNVLQGLRRSFLQSAFCWVYFLTSLSEHFRSLPPVSQYLSITQVPFLALFLSASLHLKWGRKCAGV